MGRMIRRVPKGFDWPIGVIWPGFKLDGNCSAIDSIADNIFQKTKRRMPREERCGLCRKWAKLTGIEINKENCPDLSKITDPPKGRYYQLWNTTTEGHPMSPPFKTPEELAQWLVDNKISSYGYQTATYEEWLKFIKGPGWSPSGIVIMKNGKTISGIETVG